jgi:starch-binding outer membrane protein, SusD/RagB family
MKIIKISGCIVLLLLAIAGCRKNYLDISPRSFLADDQVWASTANADLFLNDLYNQLPDINNETEHLDQYTDNSDVGVLWMKGYANMATAQITPGNVPTGPWDMWKWSAAYQKIRRCNLFIEKVSASKLPDDYKAKRIAEVRFIRALFYHWLWMAYGGIPVITDVLDNNTGADNIYRPRSSERETFTFIDNELDTVSKILPATYGAADHGRPTSGAALTLKGWCELFEASALRNTGNDVSRWRLAAATNKKVIDMGVYDLVPDFTGLFLFSNNNSMESIFARQYGPNKGSTIIGKEGPTMNGANAQVSWGNFQPTQELVDDFAMSNGKAITEPGSGYDAGQPYANREARFYQTILYDGAPWRDFTIYTRTGGNNAIDLGYSSDKTHTGYYARKRLDSSMAPGTYFNGICYQNYIFFRYAEVLLNFAEAENEVNGATAEALAAVNKVRARGKLPSVEDTWGTVNKSQLRAIIRRERRVELCFEDKRWWDILRWKIADGSTGVLNRPETGMVITGTTGNLTYTPTKVRDRLFLPKMYTMPIPQPVLDQNPAIVKQSGTDGWVNGQNPGY